MPDSHRPEPGAPDRLQVTVSVPRAGQRLGLPRGAHVPGLILLALIWAAWLWHLPQGGDMREWGISAAALAQGRWQVLLLNIFAHAGLLHIGMNSAVLAGLAPIQVTVMGGGWRGGARLFAFFLLAGLAGGLLYVALNPGGAIPAVGASGAISGMIGFVSRIGGPGRLLPLFSGELLRRVWDFVKANLILMALFAIPFLFGGSGILIAWEGHLGGLLFGLVAAGAFVPRGRR